MNQNNSNTIGATTTERRSAALNAMPMEVLEAHADKIENQRLVSYYRQAPEQIQLFCWNLLQESMTPRSLPLLLAFTLTMGLLEHEEHCQWWEANKHSEEPEEAPSNQDDVIARFWRGTQGFGAGAPKGVEPALREAITHAARTVFALPEIQTRTLEGDEGELVEAYRKLTETHKEIILAVLRLLTGKGKQGGALTDEQRAQAIATVRPELEAMRAEGRPQVEMEAILTQIDTAPTQNEEAVPMG